jgi:proteasome lid subunit RPN8/RPN11
MELQPENLAKWSAPECPFAVEYSPRVLDDIRLAVMDAFFSLPRGGAEIGGLLLGRREAGRIRILDSAPIACEHAFGPSFVLSERDHAKLAELVADASKRPALEALGWWHSHTRSEIFLSEADQKIHNSFCPEPWQVAIVLKPHTFQPTRAGIFFRAADGSIRGETTSSEIVLEPLPLRPAGPIAPPAPEDSLPMRGAPDHGRVIDLAAMTAAVTPVEAPAPEEPVEHVPPPSFLRAAEALPPEPRRWIGWVAAVFGVALAIVGYSTRDRWLPLAQPGAAAPAEAIALHTTDTQGELLIRWNGAATPVSAAASGNLLILDGGATVTVPLDPPHVQSGAFTYRRRSGRVDVTLALAQPGGKEVRVATLFTGDPPSPAAAQAAPPPAAVEPSPADSAMREELKAANAANASLKAELAKQVERNRLLEKGMEELRKALQRDQQRTRLEAQSPEK